MPSDRSVAARARAQVRRRITLPRNVIVLGIIAFCVAVGFGVLVPVLPVFARNFGVGNFEVGAVVSVFAVMRLATSPFCGRLIDWLGERSVLAVGIGIVALSSGLAGLSQSYFQLLALRGLGGIGSAMFTVSAMTLLLGAVEPTMRGRATGFYQGGFLLGGVAGPAIGGLLAAISITAPFFFYAGTLAVAGVVGLVMLRPVVRADDGGPATVLVAKPLREVLADVRFRAACVANLAQGWNSFGVRSSLVPVLVVEVLHRDSSWTGIAFACAAIVQTIVIGPAGAMVDRIGRRIPIVGSAALAAVSILVVPFAPNIFVLIVILCVYGIASAFLGTAPAASVGDAAGAHGGRAVAIFSMCSDAGAIVGPLVAGALADRVSYPVAFAVGAALLFASSLYALRMPRGGRSSVHFPE